jgi:thiamine biosynthesis protein ThiC
MSDIYQEILEFEKMKNIDRDQLVENYVQQMIEGMDYKTMERFVYDTMVENLTDYTDEELLTEVTDYYPELLGEDETL